MALQLLGIKGGGWVQAKTTEIKTMMSAGHVFYKGLPSIKKLRTSKDNWDKTTMSAGHVMCFYKGFPSIKKLRT